jgi:aryl-alcohol dehydrogenase (NADP+)
MTFGVESDEPESQRILDVFVAAGGTLIDTADIYGDGESERILGRWLANSGTTRDRLIIATKGRFPVSGQPGASLRKRYLHGALEKSLRRLGLDRVDVYLSHGPDSSTPLEELVEFFAEAVDAGQTRFVGVSNLAGWQIAKVGLLAREARVPLVWQQPQYNLLAREVEWEVLPAGVDAGVEAVAWGPLAAGWLTGKYGRGRRPTGASRLGENPERGVEAWDRRGTERTWTIIDHLREVASERDLTPAQAALAWVSARPGVVSAIVGARHAGQLDETLAAGDIHLDDEATGVLDEISEPATPDYPYRILAEFATLS